MYTEERVHTMTATDSFRTAAATRYVLNAVRATTITSKSIGTANIPKALVDTLTGRHTPDNGSYMIFSADSLETFHGFLGNTLTVERLDDEDR